jgi:hypothetical protein
MAAATIVLFRPSVQLLTLQLNAAVLTKLDEMLPLEMTLPVTVVMTASPEKNVSTCGENAHLLSLTSVPSLSWQNGRFSPEIGARVY